MQDTKDIAALKLLAPKCPNHYACLENSQATHGEVEYCVNDKVLFVKEKDDYSCPYKKHFGYSLFCACPIRLQIYLESKKDIR